MMANESNPDYMSQAKPTIYPRNMGVALAMVHWPPKRQALRKRTLITIIIIPLIVLVSFRADAGEIPRANGPIRAFFPLFLGAYPASVEFTILHTNDLHGYLESDSSGRGGAAYLAGAVRSIREQLGDANVVLVDAGDAYLGAAPISQLLLGESTIDIYNMLGYDVACYGNHEFDKLQTVLISRTVQSNFPWIGANIVLEGTAWDTPWWSRPYITMTVGVPGQALTLGILGLVTDETPLITVRGATEGLVFKDPTETVLHYYHEIKSQSDALIVLAHIGTDDSGSFKGLRRVAQELIAAGTPVDLIIGGHQHEVLFRPIMVGDTVIVEAGAYGRYMGRLTVSVDRMGKRLAVRNYQLIPITNRLPADPEVQARVAYWAGLVQPLIERPVGLTNVSLMRDYNNESNMGNLVTDGMRWKADQYDDGLMNESVEIAFTNPGGLRADIRIPAGVIPPYSITWGDTFHVMPFGNTLFVMDLTGAQIQTLLDQSASLAKGILQTSGARWQWRNDCRCSTPTTWGAYHVTVHGAPLEAERVYRVVTNDFLAGGQDGWTTFAEGTNRWNTYLDMQEAVNEYIRWYNEMIGPLDHRVEGRITYMP